MDDGFYKNLIQPLAICQNRKLPQAEFHLDDVGDEKSIHTISCIRENLKKSGLVDEALGNLSDLTQIGRASCRERV